MKLLLDTHIWLWSALDPDRLSARVGRLLQDPENELWLSSISVWETLVLARKKRVVLEPTPAGWVREALASLPIREAPVTHEIAIESERLERAPDDPADRFLLATAVVNELTLVTADARLLRTPRVPVLANRSRVPNKR